MQRYTINMRTVRSSCRIVGRMHLRCVVHLLIIAGPWIRRWIQCREKHIHFVGRSGQQIAARVQRRSLVGRWSWSGQFVPGTLIWRIHVHIGAFLLCFNCFCTSYSKFAFRRCCCRRRDCRCANYKVSAKPIIRLHHQKQSLGHNRDNCQRPWFWRWYAAHAMQIYANQYDNNNFATIIFFRVQEAAPRKKLNTAHTITKYNKLYILI